MHPCRPSMILILVMMGVVLPKDKIRSQAAIVDEKSQEYLKKFGYLTEDESGGIDKFVLDESSIKNAIKRFQAFANLNVTGVMDEATVAKMAQPRCGMKDVNPSFGGATGKERFSARDPAWDKMLLTYYLRQSTPDLPRAKVEAIMAAAFKMWSDVADLAFQREETAVSHDITLYFGTTNLPDGNDFDGPGRILAYAYFPTVGDAYFDEDEEWTDGTPSGINLLYVATHEFGHSLGLDHSSIDGATMAPFIPPYDPNFSLHPDDVAGIQSLYGPAVARPPICDDPSIDAITTMDNGVTYIFKGRKYYTLTPDNKLASSSPQNIASSFGLKRFGKVTKLRSAFTDWNDATYLLTNMRFWRIKNQLASFNGKSRKITTKFSKVLERNDAAFLRERDNKLYSVKNLRSSAFSSPKAQRSRRRTTLIWTGINTVDAAWQGPNGYIYFFEGTSVYRYKDQNKDSNPGSEESIAAWLGCP